MRISKLAHPGVDTIFSVLASRLFQHSNCGGIDDGKSAKGDVMCDTYIVIQVYILVYIIRYAAV